MNANHEENLLIRDPNPGDSNLEEIDSLNLENLDIEELEHRLELATSLEPGCGVNWLWD
jgi:hypothetical protein